jgi:hypothetical protein
MEKQMEKEYVTVLAADLMPGDTLKTDKGPVLVAKIEAWTPGSIGVVCVKGNTENILPLRGTLKVEAIRGKQHAQHMAALMAYARLNPVPDPELKDAMALMRREVDQAHRAEVQAGVHA